jgi:hypothetical protein
MIGSFASGAWPDGAGRWCSDVPAPAEEATEMRAHDVMSSPVVFLRPRVPADVAAALLVAHGLPIFGRADRP